MLGATSVMSSEAGSCSWRAGLTTELEYLPGASFGQSAGAEGPSGRRRAGLRGWHEHPLAVEAQLRHALADVVKGPVGALFLGPVGAHAWVPAPHQRRHRRPVDRPGAQPVLDRWQVGGQEAP